MEENNDQIDESKRLKIDPDTQPEVAGNEPETKSLLAEIENVPVVNLDSSVESSGSREEQKAANNDKGRVVKWLAKIVIVVNTITQITQFPKRSQLLRNFRNFHNL